jgi:serine/threonine kinase 32
MLGGDLRCMPSIPPLFPPPDLSLVHLERKGGLPEDAVKFWVAELSSGLAYLHKQHIVHRWVIPWYYADKKIFDNHLCSDLKPDNILLDREGHAHLTDFNVAIHFSERRQHTSVAGSMAYMAPQVLSRKGYSYEIDYWSLGVTAYELIFHKRPFDGRDANRMTQSILKDPLLFPSDSGEKLSSEGIAALRKVCYSHTCCSLLYSRVS